MKYVVTALCIALIVLAFVFLFRFLRDSFKGKCCENCKSCRYSGKCNKK